MNAALEASYAACRRVARRSASNFYFSFWLLPPAKRRAMHALYAFLRAADDAVDTEESVEIRRRRLDELRADWLRALDGAMDHPLFPALADTVAQFHIPHEYLATALDGVAMDLEQRHYVTFAELEEYCYRVASVVGLACVHIWGFRDSAVLSPARSCGIAFQLTNILRDLHEDAARDRCYLPDEDLRQFGYSFDDLRRGIADARFNRLLAFEVDRADRYYDEAAATAAYLAPDGQRIFGAMFEAYRKLLHEIGRVGSDVLTRRVRLSPWRKWMVAAKWCIARPTLRLASDPRPTLSD